MCIIVAFNTQNLHRTAPAPLENVPRTSREPPGMRLAMRTTCNKFAFRLCRNLLNSHWRCCELPLISHSHQFCNHLALSTPELCIDTLTSFLLRSHTRTLVTAANDLPARDTTMHQHQTHFTGPTSASITTFLPCLLSGGCGSRVTFPYWRIHGRSREAATMQTKITLVIAR